MWCVFFFFLWGWWGRRKKLYKKIRVKKKKEKALRKNSFHMELAERMYSSYSSFFYCTFKTFLLKLLYFHMKFERFLYQFRYNLD